MSNPYTRAEFDHLRSLGNRLVRRHSIVLAIISVSLGVGSLWFIQWADARFPRPQRIIFALGTFAIFIGIVGWLLFRMKRTARNVALKCPQCSEPLKGDTERIASATGKCEKCGGVVING